VAAGSRRTAEELGRSFPGAVIRASDRETPVVSVGPEPVLVVATPGAEPVAEGGYAAVLLLDGGAMLARPDLRAGEEALRRWAVAASLCRSAADGGRVVVMADPALPVVQALLRWDPATYTEREARDRTELHFPPAARVATVDGPADAVADLLARAAPLPKGAEVLGPVPHGEGERAVVRVPWPQGNALSVRLKEGLGVRSAKKAEGVVRVELDPYL
jgi:primosomal protein N' (replication factor Y)